jgi:hypothetical protein
VEFGGLVRELDRWVSCVRRSPLGAPGAGDLRHAPRHLGQARVVAKVRGHQYRGGVTASSAISARILIGFLSNVTSEHGPKGFPVMLSFQPTREPILCLGFQGTDVKT